MPLYKFDNQLSLHRQTLLLSSYPLQALWHESIQCDEFLQRMDIQATLPLIALSNKRLFDSPFL